MIVLPNAGQLLLIEQQLMEATTWLVAQGKWNPNRTVVAISGAWSGLDEGGVDCIAGIALLRDLPREDHDRENCVKAVAAFLGCDWHWLDELSLAFLHAGKATTPMTRQLVQRILAYAESLA